MPINNHQDILNMSDEDFLNSSYVPPSNKEVTETEKEKPVETETISEEPEVNNSNETNIEEDNNEEKHSIVNDTEVEKDNPVENNEESNEVNTSKENSEVEAEKPSINYEDSYKEILAPFKANGKMVDIKNPEEARKLMQMGANYTKKMQELQPTRKLVATLQKYGLTDENELNYLIDLKQKNPEAIKKLLKDSNINPMDIDLEQESSYKAGNHQVSNEEANFKSTLDDIASTPTGSELISLIQQNWDETSKNAIWQNPNILNELNEHKQNGNYDIVNNEVERRKMLGIIPSTTPFINAYDQVAREMVQEAQKRQQNQPIATRTATKPSVVKNDTQAKAAASTRVAPTKGKTTEEKNPLSMSDDDFLKYLESKKG